MESPAGAPLRAHGLRALGQPRPVEMQLEEGRLSRVTLPPRGVKGGVPRTLVIEGIQQVWRVAEAWWRDEPVQRTYYQVLVDGGIRSARVVNPTMSAIITDTSRSSAARSASVLRPVARIRSTTAAE